MLVYNLQCHINCFDDWFSKTSPFAATVDLKQALEQEIKIAAVPYQFELYQPDFPYKDFDLLLISDIEYNHIRVVRNWLKQKDIKNYLLALGGIEQDFDLTEDFLFRPWWMFNLMSKNLYVENDCLKSKKYKFDILLGAKKPHRDFIMASLQANRNQQLLNKTITTYREVFKLPHTIVDANVESEVNRLLGRQKLHYPFVPYWLQPEWEVGTEVKFNDSYRVPWRIFDQTDYTVIAETVHDRSFFPTEKITKPLFAQRLFVVFSCQHFLKNLHNMGFKTFDCVIDESYDNIKDNVERYTAAFEQVKYLINADSATIKRQILPIVEHNHNRLFEYRQEIREQMLQMIHNKIRKIKDANSIQ